MVKVFISHSYDDHEYADELREALAKLQIGGRFDLVETASYDTLFQVIRERLEAADAVIILLSKQALASSWVMVELGAAQALGKKVVPIVLADTDVDKLDFIEKDRTMLDARTLSPSMIARRIEQLITEDSNE